MSNKNWKICNYPNCKRERCDFDGLGKIVATNPSVENCEFPIEILAFQDQIVQNGMVLRI